MRVLVAGGAGFVGSNVCRRLLADGHDVVCVDNLLTGSLDNIQDLLPETRFGFVQEDIRSAPDADVDLVLHLASPASPVDYDRFPLETLDANSSGTARLLGIASRRGARFLFASTSEVYGDPLIHPQPETYWGNVDPIGPRACYDEAKRFGEALVMSWRRVHGARAGIIRIFNTYGPAMRLDDGRVIPELLRAALGWEEFVIHGDGLQTRSFMHVDDLVDGMLLVAFDPRLDGAVVNVGNPEELSIAELVQRVGRLIGRQLPVRYEAARPGDPRQRRPDIGRMRVRYGWSPRVELEDGLRRTLDWYREHPTAGRPLELVG